MEKTVKDIIHSEKYLKELECEVENGPDFVATLRKIADIHNLLTSKKA